MKLLTDMKTKIKFAVDFAYEFDTSVAPDSISRNVTRAQALLAKTTFIYQVRLIAITICCGLRTVSVNRTSTQGSIHDIHIDIPLSNRSSTSYGSITVMPTGLSFMSTSHPFHSKLLLLQSRWYGLKSRASWLNADGSCPLFLDRVLHQRVVYWHMQRVHVDRRALQSQLLFASQLAL